MFIADLSPFLIQFSDNFGIRWYGLSYVVAFLLALILMRWISLRQNSGVSGSQLMDFVTVCAVGVLLGGRLGYCLLYAPDLFLKFRPEFPFWGIFAIGEGGMSAHGGIVGLIVGAILFGINQGISRRYLFDLMAFGAPLGIFLGRVANFVNGELVGRPVEEGAPLAVKFPTDIYRWPYEAADKLPALSEIVEKLGRTGEPWSELLAKSPTDDVAKAEVGKILVDIVSAIQSGQTQLTEMLTPMLVWRHPSQLYEAVGEGLLVFILLFILWYKPRRPGVIGASFLIFYSVGRIVSENFRMPDVQIGFELFGLTRGQWLSILTLVIGLILLVFWSRSGSLSTSGWGRGRSVSIHRR
jgi:phosphatidylglycerol:prolipoprotein diacylglycerol transferase